MKIIIILISVLILITIILWNPLNDNEHFDNFDWEYYINNNPNIPKNINTIEQAFRHYEDHGKLNNYSIYPIVHNRNVNKNTYLSIISVFKNEGMIIDTWIRHYIWQGVEHFYLIDNNSDDNSLDILQPYIDQGIVTVYKLPGKYKQMAHIKYVCDNENLKENTKWLINADVDEFYYCIDGTVKDNLRNYEDYYLIYSKWRQFGSSGLKDQPADLRLAFTKRKYELSTIGKYIFQPKYSNYNFFENRPHELLDIDKNKTIDLSDVFRINHYRIMSLEYWTKIKMTRGDVAYDKQIRDMNDYNDFDKNATFEDNELKNLLKKI